MFDTLGVVWQDLVDQNMMMNDSSVSLCRGLTDTLHCLYDANGIVCIIEVQSTTRFLWGPPNWTTAYQLSMPTFQSRHPYCDQVQDRVYAVYRQRDPMGNISIARQMRFVGAPPMFWMGLTGSRIDANPKDYPVSSGDRAFAWAESTSGGNGNWEIMARVGLGPDTIVNLTKTSGQSKFCHILADSMVGASPSSDRLTVRCCWSEEMGQDTWTTSFQPVPVLFGVADPNATEHNNCTKIIRDASDSIHVVFTGRHGIPFVGYARAKTGIDDWSRQFLAPGDQSSISRDSTGTFWIAGRGPDARSIQTFSWRSGQSRQQRTLYDCPAFPVESTSVGAPCVAGFKWNPYLPDPSGAYMLSRSTTTGLTALTRVLVKTGQLSTFETDTIDRVGFGDDSLPTIGVQPGNWVHLAWQRKDEIYCKVGCDTSLPGQHIAWSSAYDLSNTNGYSCHPALQVSPETSLVAWSEGNPGRIMVKGQPLANAYDAWGDSTTISGDSTGPCDFPTISLGDTTIVAFQESTSTGYQVFVNAGLADNHQVTTSAGPAKLLPCGLRTTHPG